MTLLRMIVKNTNQQKHLMSQVIICTKHASEQTAAASSLPSPYQTQEC